MAIIIGTLFFFPDTERIDQRGDLERFLDDAGYTCFRGLPCSCTIDKRCYHEGLKLRFKSKLKPDQVPHG